MKPEPPAAGPGRAAPDNAGEAPGTDRSTLEGVRRREPEALARFFEAHVDGIYDLAFRMLGERAMAEDVTQDVFLRVHRAADRLDPARDPGPWLRKITRNACRDVWRSAAWKSARRSVSVDTEIPPGAVLADPPVDPEAAASASERERLVQAAILELPGTLREVVVLHAYGGLRHDEIAEVVGASHAAVRKRYSRAVERLGERLRRILE